MAWPKVGTPRQQALDTCQFIVVPWKKLRWVKSPHAPLVGSLHSPCLYNSLERYRSIYIAMNHAVNWATRNDKDHKSASLVKEEALHMSHTCTRTHTHRRKKQNETNDVLWKTTTWQKHMLTTKTAWAAPTPGLNRAQCFAAELKCYPVIHDKAYFGRLKKWDASISPAVHNLLRSQCKRAYQIKRLKKDSTTNKPLKATSRHSQKHLSRNFFASERQYCRATASYCKPPYCCLYSLKSSNRLFGCSTIECFT